jgi:hypothetical protein
MEKPKILKKTSTKEVQESGCCFTSCGGMPIYQYFDEEGKNKSKVLQKIKQGKKN